MIFAFELPSVSGRMLSDMHWQQYTTLVSVYLQYQLMLSDELDICDRSSFDMSSD
jgi:hypothetical protein